MSYAKDTSVSVSKSQATIRKLLLDRDADQIAFAEDAGESKAVVAFRMRGRAVRIELRLPSRDEERFTHTPATLKERSREAATKAWEQACRSQWRALFLVIKAKLVAVEAGITTFEREFLADMVLPNGETAGQFLLPQVELGTMPPMLPLYGGRS
jgi:hypothetical protein